MNISLPEFPKLSAAPRFRCSESCLIALLVFLSLTFLMRGGFEKQALNSPHDDLNFLERSEVFDHRGSQLAFIKEYPYSFFIKVGRTLGLPLWDFELITYCLALVVLWRQLALAFGSFGLAWASVLPLCFFPYLHYVFQRATYDSLQLILTPLAFATALGIWRSAGAWRWIIAAGLVGSVQLATRPEGFIFCVPVVMAGAYLWLRGLLSQPSVWYTSTGIIRGGVLFALFISIPLLMITVHSVFFGFRAQTIMKTAELQGALSLLMKIDPGEEDGGRYAPFPIAAMEKGMAVSPALARTRPYFDRTTGGMGWSGFTGPRERTTDLSISGGHFQWAWLNASAKVAGNRPRDILYFNLQVAEELEAAFARGDLPQRRLLTTALGPNFSIFSGAYWQSVGTIGKDLFHWHPVRIPQRAGEFGSRSLDRAYDRLALRRTVWIRDRVWGKEGWVLGVRPDFSQPVDIRLENLPEPEKVNMTVVNRPDVKRAFLPEIDDENPFEIGFEIESRATSIAGDLVVELADSVIRIPLADLKAFPVRRTTYRDNLQFRIDMEQGRYPSIGIAGHVAFVQGWFRVQHQIARYAIPLAALLLVFLVLRARNSAQSKDALIVLGGVLLAATAVFGLFWALLSGIDAFMYPGREPRYLAPAAFSLWMAVSLIYAVAGREFGRCLIFWRRQSAPEG